eukprot:907023-Prymnesium_polylepis.1
MASAPGMLPIRESERSRSRLPRTRNALLEARNGMIFSRAPRSTVVAHFRGSWAKRRLPDVRNLTCISRDLNLETEIVRDCFTAADTYQIASEPLAACRITVRVELTQEMTSAPGMLTIFGSERSRLCFACPPNLPNSLTS